MAIDYEPRCRLEGGGRSEVVDAMAMEHQDEDTQQGRGFVVVVSDANFKRYRMDPLWWSEALQREPRVAGHAAPRTRA